MPYCYACRNSKPATHGHFSDYGALALRPPKRHITEIEALWDSMSEEQQGEALTQGRELLAQKASQEGETGAISSQRAPRASSSRAPRRRTSTPTGAHTGANGWIAAGLALAGLGAGAFLLWVNPEIAIRLFMFLGEHGGEPGA